MAPHSTTLAWKIPWMKEPSRLQSMGSLRVVHDWATSLSLFTFMHWRRKWQPTPVFLPGESQGWGSLVGCHLWGCTELDTTEVKQQQQQLMTRHFFSETLYRILRAIIQTRFLFMYTERLVICCWVAEVDYIRVSYMNTFVSTCSSLGIYIVWLYSMYIYI